MSISSPSTSTRRASTFADLGVAPNLVASLAARGIEQPFPIQAMTLPDGLAGRDVSGRAPTGSGKTIAFGLPLVTRTSKSRPHHPTGLVLVPTRELAAQVTAELRLLASRDKRIVAIYGGVGFAAQRNALHRGVDIVVACPGRLADLIGQGDIRLDEIEIAVVDEADRMADMGFLPEVRRLLDATPRSRQTLLFSATLDGDVDVLVRNYQHNPVRHMLTEDHSNIPDATHHFWNVPRNERIERCAEIVSACGPTMVFCRTKRGADRLADRLDRSGIRTTVIHGNRSQNQRQRALDAFAAGQSQALVATDVAARGIHVDDVAVVLHFDPPAEAKDYVHRSGRTARAGATGLVITLVDSAQRAEVNSLQRALGMPTEITAPDLRQLRDRPTAAPLRQSAPPARSHRDGRSTRRPNHGELKFFDHRRGFGFIARPGAEDLFVHVSAVSGIPAKRLVEGTRLRFDIEPGRQGVKSVQAARVAVV